MEISLTEKQLYWVSRIFFTAIIIIIYWLVVTTIINKYGDKGFVFLIFFTGIGIFLQLQYNIWKDYKK